MIVLNINNWGGGVTGLWRADAGRGMAKESYSDGLLEVIGLTDIVHMGQVQVGIDEPFQVAQGGRIVLRSKVENMVLNLQIDGEPIEIVSPF